MASSAIGSVATVPTGPAGGDLSTTYPNPTVAKINGVTVPATPTAGQLLVASSGTAAAWTTPVVGLAIGTVNQLIANSSADFGTGVLINGLVGNNHRWKITFSCFGFSSNVANDGVWIKVQDGATLLNAQQAFIPTASGSVPCCMVSVLNSGATTHNLQILVARVSGTGLCGFTADPRWPATLLVEDLGS